MTKTALIAGQGALPGRIAAAMAARGDDFVTAELMGFAADIPGHRPIAFRLERLVPFLDRLHDEGVTRVCLAGAVRRPQLEPDLFDPRTAMLLPSLLAALRPGDDGALRAILALFEDHGFAIVGADRLAPDLLPPTGVLTTLVPAAPGHERDAAVGEATVNRMGQEDSGQACIIAAAAVVAKEGPEGTDAMLRVCPAAPGGILFKAPKPHQDRRVDLPVIGPGTAELAASAGLAGLVIEAGGVMVIDLDVTLKILGERGLFLWVRPKGGGR